MSSPFTLTGTPGTGGTIQKIGGYAIHSFTSIGGSTFTIPYNITAEILMVAGGGAGGAWPSAGGGGAGGVVYIPTKSLTAGSYTVFVGNGGQTTSATGGNSYISGQPESAIGGGGGATNGVGFFGGSGGGSQSTNPSAVGGAGQPGQGNDGGAASAAGPAFGGGGGGGAVAVGGTGTGTSGGWGGPGVQYSISGTPTWYGGGGGGDASGGIIGNGGLGGGGAASHTSPATSGTPNTGGGGGACGTSGGTPGLGGTGIIIIKYMLQASSLAVLGYNYAYSTSGLLAYYDTQNPMDKNPISGTTWYDRSGNGRTVTLRSGSTYNSSSKYISMDGTINSGTTVAQLGTSPTKWTIMLSFYQTNSIGGLYTRLAGSSPSLDCGEIALFNDLLFINPPETGWTSTSFSTTFNTWYHLCVAFDTTTTGVPNTWVYINGNLIYSATLDGTLETLPTGYVIGSDVVYDTQALIGYMSLFAVYNRVLPAQEVLLNYNVYKYNSSLVSNFNKIEFSIRPSPYYSFTSFNFNPAGATGATGPTTLAAYGTTYPGYGTAYALSIGSGTSTGMQLWIVPESASYTFVVAGAAGGAGGVAAGKGAIITLTLTLTKGDVIKLLIGQQGTSSTSNCPVTKGGAGGGSFVYNNTTSTLLAVAGGGGGGAGGPIVTAGLADASLTTSGKDGDGGSTSGAGGLSGSGGAGASPACTVGGGGGGGFTGNGTDGIYNGVAGSPGPNGGKSFTNGGTGGFNTNEGNTYGGFGGGGASGNHCGGGGGGYSGGGGGGLRTCNCSDTQVGGGGGSYGTVGFTSSSVTNTGDGYITVTKN